VPSERNRIVTAVMAIEHKLRRRLLAHGVAEAEVDDFVQEVYVRVIETVSAADAKNVEAYAWTMARNLVTDDRRRAKTRWTARMNVAVRFAALSESVAGADEEVHARQLLVKLQHALEALPASIREVVLMSKHGGSSQKEIAAIKGLTENSVESYLSDGKDLLDQELQLWLEAEERSLIMGWLWPRRRNP
jgi:RNA polymerase sigma factor (sigma-70 family)